MAEEQEKKKKTKRPTAEKRMVQNEKKRGINRSFKASVRTAIRRFEGTLTNGDSGTIKQQLDEVYSLMDKGVKRGIYKLNKASRTKSRLAAKAAAKQ